jgi:hypothetical protein
MSKHSGGIRVRWGGPTYPAEIQGKVAARAEAFRWCCAGEMMKADFGKAPTLVVVVDVDGSGGSAAAPRPAAAVARLRRARVRIVRAWHLPPVCPAFAVPFVDRTRPPG